MQVLHKIQELREFLSQAKKEGKTIGLVPTMGYFHEGHLSLMRRAREENDIVVVSLFVNPTQFGQNEDLERYPRKLERDSEMAKEIGVDVIFNPPVEEMYPEGFQTYVEPGPLSKVLCGAHRPGHFRGVATVVLKLFNIIQPDKAYFGMKDYQQLRVIQQMVQDLNVPIEIVPMPTVRETDGLAMSSRNTYLNSEEREAALVLSKSLKKAEELFQNGITSGEELRKRVEEIIHQTPLAAIEYVAVVNPETLTPLEQIDNEALVALAVKIGTTRLIDNALLKRKRN